MLFALLLRKPLVLLEVMEKCSLVIDSQHVKYLRKCTMFRSDVKQNEGNNMTFGVILLALEVMSIKFPLLHTCFVKQILVDCRVVTTQSMAPGYFRR